MYVLPDGLIYAYGTKTVTKNPTNQIPLSINSDGSQYVGTNGEDGYKSGYRLNSSGAETTGSNYKVTGFMPAKFGDDLRFEEISGEGGTSNTKICFYDASFAILNLIQSDGAINAIANGVYSKTIFDSTLFC